MNAGPLGGLTVIELAGLAPAPFAATMLADLGADVVRVDRASPGADVLGIPNDPLTRSRRTIGVDTKTPDGVEVVLSLAERADVLIEGFRPGVAERMGLGPEQVHARNPRLVYGRITGWGQDGPLAPVAGHDINYIGLSGALSTIGRAGDKPVAPVNYLGDFGGGGLYLAMGVLAALYERMSSGVGQVVDASMVDGSALLTTQLYGMKAAGAWSGERGANLLDGGAPFYDTYACADGRYVAVGAIEMRFWAALVEVLELDAESLPLHLDQSQWPKLREILAEAIGKYSRDELVAKAAGTDACLTPVLTPEEAADHPHNVARGTFAEVGGMVQPAPGPKFGRTPAPEPQAPHPAGADTAEVLGEFGYDGDAIAALREAGAVA
ncbi:MULTISPECIES: CaiB/BaiF CoA transferase family protein [Prauserella salsuginis group]|uniref:Alpha-methylacyl-CoA racemase n=2 Tax=Prauserella salsuginis group TaxID=2893672 RepID=A0A839XUE5_9PSEU|nr:MULTISPECIES: CaiB/BaiF CoA-transferase family protein [Prauserella salsuginis group]MBB3665014.1 alpha-methylacyl-CoA racemase [Prauserella sediminis]MCR3718485.1 alpha-methylacyl-CoA racemase [Prauserella flava]MCR3733055.1 alpha-methylacyl-CoA racemase [Prauserella salsuginis]